MPTAKKPHPQAEKVRRSDVQVGSTKMAFDTLQITTTVTHTLNFNKTNAEMSELLNIFISDYAGEVPPEMDTVTKQNNWRLEQAHNKMWEWVRKDIQRLKRVTRL